MCDRIINVIRNMPVGSLRPLLQALISQLPDDPSSVVISVKSEVEPPSSPTNGINGTLSGPVYDPSMVYVLELCTVLATRDNETINAFGADVAEALQNVIRNSSSWHYVMVSRTIFYLLHLLHASYVSISSIMQLVKANISRNNHIFVYLWSSTLSQALRRICSRNPLHLSFKA